MATERVIVSTAPLVIEYAKRSASPMSEAIEARLTIRPPLPSAIIFLTPYLRQKKTPSTLTLYTSAEASVTERTQSGWVREAGVC